MSFRIKGKNWKRFHCCGQRRVLKKLPTGQLAMIRSRCGKGYEVRVQPVTPPKGIADEIATSDTASKT